MIFIEESVCKLLNSNKALVMQYIIRDLMLWKQNTAFPRRSPPHPPSTQRPNTGSGKPFCFITKKGSFKGGQKIQDWSVFVLPVFPFLWNASIQIAAAEMSPPSLFWNTDVLETQAFLVSFICFVGLKCTGLQTWIPVWQLNILVTNFFFVFCVFVFCFYHIMPFLFTS